jgi:predicted Zn-dependent peptidase
LRLAAPAFALLLATLPALAQDLTSFEKRVSVKVLANGLTILVCERREAPVFSFFTHVDVGGAQEVPGITGLAHMFEHMAFKGTHRIGTTDWAKEKLALERVERAYAAWQSAARRPRPEPAAVAALAKAFRDAVAEADRYVLKDEFSQIVERHGGTGLNAYTNSDETGYFYSLPSNRLELWAHMESERFLRPVMREFYKERDVVLEERRMRTDSDPIGRLLEQYTATAYTAHPYGQPVVGWPSDLRTFSATDAQRFYEKHYVPANVTIAVVGDISAREVFALVEKYFGAWPAGPKPEPLRTAEPPQRALRTVTVRERTQPFYVEGYHKPAEHHPDDVVFEVIQDLLSTGRTSRLYRSLIRDKKIAAEASGFYGYPGRKYPNLFTLYAVPTPGHTPAEVQAAIRAELERLRSEEVTPAELKMIRTRVKARLLRSLASNQGLAMLLGRAQARLGDWREVFRRVERIDRVTKGDILRVAREVFVERNRTVAILESTRPAPAGGGR